ncbi:hypothetical protein F0P96_15225 [Hymenobacter busanensis]|uniref:Uncharacterized protein n=1 Tax=Hymenobacter busanensis TaxID=2607656 RepID=A0A7L5A169_9BACT|nr:DUF6799 domain-containing protein [Hymenobacter busanensis]KAA9331583.1 hypothetical protein F0P96_15225 [Hymenobacter busanensis]QHJ08735.1 hypothetical protein GUY19_16160 [Hymenobacter busanensis]
MLLRLLLSTVLLISAAGIAPALAQNTPAAATSYSLKDGAFRLNGVTMRLQAGQAMRLEGPLTLNDGSVINPTGILVKKDGTRQLLPEGRAVNMQGEVVNLRDDMQSAQAIEQHDRQVTGATETRVVIPGTSGTAATPAQAQQLQRLEQRLALLQQLSEKLSARATQALSATPNATSFDEQLRAVDAQLRP